MKNKIIIYPLLLLILSYSVYYLFYKGNSQDNFNKIPLNEIVVKSENIKDKKISWDKNIEFVFCDGLYNYTNETKGFFLNQEIVDYLVLKVKDTYRFSDNYFTNNLDYLGEYCKSEDGNKIIFWSYNGYTNANVYMFRYDKILDIVEKTELKSYILDGMEKSTNISKRDYGPRDLEKYYEKYIKKTKNSIGFGKKKGNIIPFIVYGISFTGGSHYFNTSRQNKLLKNQDNIDYCIKGLTPEGNLSVCYADIYYSYDFVNNIITEDKLCSFYIDDKGKSQTIEGCYIKN